MAQMVKNLPTMRETWVQSLGWEDPLEEGMATHSSILSWRIPWAEEPGEVESIGLQGVGHNLVTEQQQQNFNKFLIFIKTDKNLTYRQAASLLLPLSKR